MIKPLPILKADVGVVFYQQFDKWPTCAAGLRTNSSRINRVIVCNDEPWTDEGRAQILAELPGIPTLLLDHPHDGFGVARSWNEIFAEVTENYCLTIAADILLPPGHLSAMLTHAAPERMVCGKIHTTALDLQPGQDPPILRKDGMSIHWGKERIKAGSRQWGVARGANRLVHTPSWHAVGGMNPRFRTYGYEDWELAVRWMMAFGEKSIYFADPAVYHMDRDLRRLPGREATQIMADTLAEFYAHRYRLQARTSFDPMSLNACEYFRSCADITLPCARPEWIPEAKAVLITHDELLDDLEEHEVRAHLAFIVTRLAPGGRLIAGSKKWREQLPQWCREAGLEVEAVVDAAVEATRPEWEEDE